MNLFGSTEGILRIFQNRVGLFIENREELLIEHGSASVFRKCGSELLESNYFRSFILKYSGFTVSENNYWTPAAELAFDKEASNC